MEEFLAFQDFLHEFMQDSGSNIKTFADNIDCKPEAVGRWIAGKYLPAPATVIKIAVKNNISTDYMFGLSDIKTLRYHAAKTSFYERFNTLLVLRKYNPYQVAKACKISNSSIYHWKTAKLLPSISSLYRIAKLLACSLDYLLGIGEYI